MKDRVWDSAGAVAGIVFFALMVIGVGVAGDLDAEPSTPSDEVVRAMVERSDQVTRGTLIALLGLTFFFAFLAYFRRQLQRSEGQDGWLTSMAYGGGLVTAVVLLVLFSVALATTSVESHMDTQVAKVFVVYQWNYVMVFAPPMMAFTIGASLVIVRYGALPRWTGWLGFLVAVTLVMPWIGALVTMAWVLLVSFVLLIQAWRATPTRVGEAGP